jgi:2-polyprenyl-3-methyl-5-hydroxy-6-metoxy-1,4-benzoquinol methylase
MDPDFHREGADSMTTQPTIDQVKAEAFVHRAFADVSGAMVSIMCSLGDQLGLFKELHAKGSATSAELAARAGIQERYAREWLSSMASAGYITYDPSNHRFTLPAEHAPVLAQEGGPVFFGGMYQQLPALVGVYEQLLHAFRQGGGVSQAAYGEQFWDGFERFSGGWFENLLLPVWIPAMPDVQAKLAGGALVADVGCGRGRALIKLAEAFPKSRFVGYDAYAPTIDRATANAEAAGVADRVTFRKQDVVQGLSEQYDVITTFDVVHDAVDPRGLLKAIRRALKPDGVYVCLEINCADSLEENMGPMGGMFYAVSSLYCMTTSLAGNGEGLGTMGLPEAKLTAFCNEAGFGTVRRVPVDNPFNALYEIRP